MPWKTNIFLKAKEKKNPKQNRNPQGGREHVGVLRELKFILSNFIMSIKIPSSQKASDFQHENHYPPSGSFTFLAWAGVSLVAPHLHLHLPSPLHPPAPGRPAVPRQALGQPRGCSFPGLTRKQRRRGLARKQFMHNLCHFMFLRS